MRHLTASAIGVTLCAAALTACASGYGSGPPGGPVDHVPPKILSTAPDTNATNVTRRDMTIHFDKVVSERPAATQATTLADLVIVSPRNGKPDVDWHRHDIVIHPRHGWRPNTAYTVTLLPGIADLRGNVLRRPTTIRFSTGATIPATLMKGVIFDALRGAPDGGALIEAVARSDTTLVYVTAADSVGRFAFQGMLPGTYLIRGYVDENHNNGLDRTEPYDTTTLTVRDSTHVEFLTFVHDSLGPRLGTIDVVDSVTLRATFDTPIIQTQRLDTASFALLAADSTRIPLRSVVAIREDTISQPRDTTQQHRDTTALPPDTTNGGDTTVHVPPLVVPKPTRPLLVRAALITVRSPLHPKAEYRLRAVNIRGANGVVRTSDHTVTIPVPPPPPAHDTTAKPRTPRTPRTP